MPISETATLDAARENADAVSRLIEQYLDQNGKAKNAQDIIKFARLLWFIVGDVWGQFQARLDKGLEAGRARKAAASATLACESLLHVIHQLEVTLASQTEEQAEGLPELRAAVTQITAIQTAAQHLIGVLDAPEPPFDEARLSQGLTAAEHGNFENTAAIVERLQAGGEL